LETEKANLVQERTTNVKSLSDANAKLEAAEKEKTTLRDQLKKVENQLTQSASQQANEARQNIANLEAQNKQINQANAELTQKK